MGVSTFLFESPFNVSFLYLKVRINLDNCRNLQSASFLLLFFVIH